MEEQESIIRPSRRPVALPADEVVEPSTRSLSVWLAIVVIIGAAAGGFFYRQTWSEVSDDLTRLLPASSSFYLSIPSPWVQLTEAMALDRWDNPEGLREKAEVQGVFADGATGKVAGLPLAALRRALFSLQSVDVAAVPGPRGTSWLVFMEIPDPLASRNVRASLTPHLESVGRLLGYEVQRIRPDTRWLPWTESAEPMHFSFIDPWLVACLGPREALEDLIEARVAGLSQRLRGREGFSSVKVENTTALKAFLDPAFYRKMDDKDEDSGRDVTMFHTLFSGLSTLIQSVAIDDQLIRGDDMMHVEARLPRNTWLARLGAALVPPSPAFIDGIPEHATFSVGLSIREFNVLADLLRDTQADQVVSLGPSGVSLGQLKVAGQRALGELGEPGLSAASNVLSGDVVVSSIELNGSLETQHRWVLALGVNDDDVADLLIERLLVSVLPEGWIHGALYGEGKPTHHVVRYSPLWSEDTALNEQFEAGFVWSVSNGVALFAPDEESLEQYLRAPPGPLTGRGARSRRRALRNAAVSDPIFITATMPALEQLVPEHWRSILIQPLADDFQIGATVSLEGDRIKATLNVGLWSVLAALTATDRIGIDAVLLSDLSEECVRAYLALCETRPVGPICESFQPGRGALLRRICAELEM